MYSSGSTIPMHKYSSKLTFEISRIGLCRNALCFHRISSRNSPIAQSAVVQASKGVEGGAAGIGSAGNRTENAQSRWKHPSDSKERHGAADRKSRFIFANPAPQQIIGHRIAGIKIIRQNICPNLCRSKAAHHIRQQRQKARIPSSTAFHFRLGIASYPRLRNGIIKNSPRYISTYHAYSLARKDRIQ